MLSQIHGSRDYWEGCFMQRTPLLEPEGFCFWKTRFETYVKSKDIDLWEVIINGDFVFTILDPKTKNGLELGEKKNMGWASSRIGCLRSYDHACDPTILDRSWLN